MNKAKNTPPFVLVAVRRIYDRLPALVGENWPQIVGQVDSHLQALETHPDNYLASTQLFGLLAQYEPARQRLSEELIVQEIFGDHIKSGLADKHLSGDDSLLVAILSVLSWQVDSATVPSAAEMDSMRVMRGIILKAGGVDGAKSVKFQNFDIDLAKLAGVSAGFMLAGQEPKPFVIAAGILIAISTLLSEMTLQIEQQEATVFWGMIQAIGTMTGAGLHEPTITAVTNTERAKRGLDALTEQQVRASLVKLEQLKSIQKSGNTYRIVESFKVTG
jgi:hypothetical protein